LAVIVELIHIATLVHDDIMDEAERRRSQPP
jgi:Geranylgeranyl pyrophosphate synthase